MAAERGRRVSAPARCAPGRRPWVRSRLSPPRLLKESLSGNSKTAMVAAGQPGGRQRGGDASTLRYAAQARSIVTAARVNEDLSAGSSGVRLGSSGVRLRARVSPPSLSSKSVKMSGLRESRWCSSQAALQQRSPPPADCGESAGEQAGRAGPGRAGASGSRRPPWPAAAAPALRALRRPNSSPVLPASCPARVLSCPSPVLPEPSRPCPSPRVLSSPSPRPARLPSCPSPALPEPRPARASRPARAPAVLPAAARRAWRLWCGLAPAQSFPLHPLSLLQRGHFH